MKKTRKESLIACFHDAINKNSQFVAVLIRMDGYPRDEVIINHIENAKAKLGYYLTVYDEDLRMHRNQSIQIVGFTHANSFDEIQADLID